MRRLVQKLTKAKAPCGTILPFASDRCCHLPTVNSYDYRGNFIPVLYIHGNTIFHADAGVSSIGDRATNKLTDDK